MYFNLVLKNDKNFDFMQIVACKVGDKNPQLTYKTQIGQTFLFFDFFLILSCTYKLNDLSR